jgi:hypothetical protein
LANPYKHASDLSSDTLRYYFKQGYIFPDDICAQFVQWRDSEYQIVFQNVETGETFRKTAVKRGTHQFYIRNYAKFQKYLREWRSQGKLSYRKTALKQLYEGKNRTVYTSNVLFITATYNPTTYKGLYQYWRSCGWDFNRWWTSVKNRLKSRGLEVLYYFRVWEAQTNGRPHIHMMVLLSEPIKFYKQWIENLQDTRFIPLPQDFQGKRRLLHLNKMFFNWKHGITKTYGVSPKNGELPIGYLTKYIIKGQSYRPSRKDLLTQALGWVLRKRSFSHTRLKRDELNSKEIHLNNVKVYQVIGFAKDGVFHPNSQAHIRNREWFYLYQKSVFLRRKRLFEYYNWVPKDGLTKTYLRFPKWIWGDYWKRYRSYHTYRTVFRSSPTLGVEPSSSPSALDY